MRYFTLVFLLLLTTHADAKPATALLLGGKTSANLLSFVRGRGPAKITLDASCALGSIGLLTHISDKYSLQLSVNPGEMFGPCQTNRQRLALEIWVSRYFPISSDKELRWVISTGLGGGVLKQKERKLGTFSSLHRVGLEVGSACVRFIPHIFVDLFFGEGIKQTKVRGIALGFGLDIAFYL